MAIPSQNLEILALRENRISHFDFGELTKFKNLISFEIYDNCLKTIDLTKYRGESISNIWMQKNFLTELSLIGLKINFPALHTINFEENNFNCSHITDIVNVLGETVVFDLVSPSIEEPNVKEMKYSDHSSKMDIHQMKAK